MPSLIEQIVPRRKLLLVASECAILTGVLFLGTGYPPLATNPIGSGWTDGDFLRATITCLAVALICQASLSYNDLYDWRVSQNRRELPNRMLHSAGYALVMLAILVLVLPGLFRFPGVPSMAAQTWKLIILLATGFIALFGWRAAFHWFFYKWRLGEPVLVLGTDQPACDLAQQLQDNPMAGYEIIGMVGPGDPNPGASAGQRILGPVDDLQRIALENGASRVVVALKERRGQLPVEQLLDCRMAGITVEEREAMLERLTGKLSVESMRPSYLIFGRGFTKSRLVLVGKRLLDVGAAGVGLVLSSPLALLAAIAIRLDSKGPILFRQERVGQDGAVFEILKFRTMRIDAEATSGPVWAQEKDNRITRVGRFLRVSRIDEIPQFLNILAGRMSFVGPRPERPFFVEELSRQVPFYPLRHTVKPGLTGWAQVCNPYGASVEDAMEKLRYDLFYIKNMSVLFDLNIMLRTVGVILFGKGAR